MSYTIDNTIKAKWTGGVRDIKTVNSISIHYTANSGTSATAKANANYFKNCPSTSKASAHYVIDTSSVIYQCVPDNYIACAVGGSKYNDYEITGGAKLYGIVKNSNNISIEMVSCSNDFGYYIPEETINRTIELVKDLLKKYPHIKTICRHFDVTGKYCPRPYCLSKEADKKWEDFLNRIKNDESPMTEEERAEFKSLKSEVSKLKDSVEKIYHYTIEVPDWGRPTIQKLLDAGIYKGDSVSDLNLPETLLRVLVINDRAGLYDK